MWGRRWRDKLIANRVVGANTTMCQRRSLRWGIGLLVVAMLAILAACGSDDPTPTGCFDTVNGDLVPAPCDEDGGVFPPPPPPPTEIDFVSFGCAACHTIDSLPQARGNIGPNLSRIGDKGEAYIRQSIVDPNAVIAPDCPFGPCQSGLMPQFYGLSLPKDAVDALVAYLVSLK